MVTDEEVLEWMSEKRSLWKSKKKRRNKLIGHVMRRGGLLKACWITESCVEVENSKGRSRMAHM